MFVALSAVLASGLANPTLHATAAAARPRAALIRMTADVDKIFRRAEFWEEETATMLELVNVLGRFETSSQWKERTEFAVVAKAREETMAQGASVERFDYAQRNGLVERVALNLNCKKLPFTNEKLAASVGKTVEEMNAMPVSTVATEVVFDAIAQSKSSLIPENVVDQRIAKFVEGGTFNEGAFMSGMAKSRTAVIVGFFLLGKGQLYGYIVAGRVLLDGTGLYDKAQSIFGPYTEPIVWALTLGAVVYAYQQSVEVTKKTGNFEVYSREEALEKQQYMDVSTTVFDKMASNSASASAEQK